MDVVRKRTGKPMVEGGKPDFDPETVWYINTFFKLCSGRQLGMSLGPIPPSEVIFYWNEFDMLDDKGDFLDIIQALDNTLSEYINSKKK